MFSDKRKHRANHLFHFVAGGSFENIFLRGDSNADGVVDISDSVFTLSYLFFGGRAPACQDAADSNDDGAVDISDPIGALGVLFRTG